MRKWHAQIICFLILFAGCRGWVSSKPPVHLNPNMDTQEKYEDSYAIAEEFREWILHIGEENETLRNSVLNFPNELKELLDQKVNEKLIE